MEYKYKNKKSRMKNKTNRRRRNRMKNRSQKYNMVEIYKGGLAVDETAGKTEIQDEKIQHKVNYSKTLGDLGSGAWNYMTNVGKQIVTPEEKQKVEAKLKELLEERQITEDTYKHALTQINKRDGVLGIKDSMVSLLSPVQNFTKVVGDWVLNSNDENYPAKRTFVKLLWFPKSYKNFVKGSIPDKNRKDLELDEYMIVVKDIFAGPGDKIMSDLAGVDNLLANVLNGCVGAGCKNGIVKPDVVLDKSIEVTDNIQKKEVLTQMKKSYENSAVG